MRSARWRGILSTVLVRSALLALALLACTQPAGPASISNLPTPQVTSAQQVTPAPEATSSQQAMPAPAPADCPRWERKLPLEPLGQASAVNATVHLAEDPGVSAPTFASLSRLPVTIVVRFDAPVDPSTFGLTLARAGHCTYFPLNGEAATRWFSDREAHVEVSRIDELAVYALTFGRGKDREGREVREPTFQFLYPPGETTRTRIRAVPASGGAGAVDLYELRDRLHPASVSPDGRYALLLRDAWANATDHSRVRIPYVLELASQRLTPYPRTEIREIRWDVAGGWVWINGWERLALDGSGKAEAFLERVPASSDGLLVDAEVSRNARWLAVLWSHSRDFDLMGDATLVLADLSTGATHTLPRAFRYGRGASGPFFPALEWSADASLLLVASYRADAPQHFVADQWLVDVPALTRRMLPGVPESSGWVSWSPGGLYIIVPGYAIVRPDGTRVHDASEGSPVPLWTPDDRYLAFANGDQTFDRVELPSGRRVRLRLPAYLGYTAPPLGFSSDGSQVYVAEVSSR